MGLYFFPSQMHWPAVFVPDLYYSTWVWKVDVSDWKHAVAKDISACYLCMVIYKHIHFDFTLPDLLVANIMKLIENHLFLCRCHEKLWIVPCAPFSSLSPSFSQQ